MHGVRQQQQLTVLFITLIMPGSLCAPQYNLSDSPGVLKLGAFRHPSAAHCTGREHGEGAIAQLSTQRQQQQQQQQ